MSDDSTTGAEGLVGRLRGRASYEHSLYYNVSLVGGDIDLSTLLDEAATTIAALRQELDEARHASRYNVRRTPDGVAICFGEHDRGTGCAIMQVEQQKGE